MIEEKIIIKELREFVKKFDTNKQAAAALRVTQAQLSTTLRGTVNVIPEKILKKLGYKSALVYLPLKPKKTGAEAGTSKPKNVPAKAPAATPAPKVPLAERPEARESQRQAREPVVVSTPASRESDNATFIDINARD